MVFHLSVIALFLASLFDTPKREFKFNKELFYLLILCFLNIALSQFNVYVLNATVNLFLAIIGIFVIVKYVDDIKGMYKIILLSGLINVLIYLIQYLGYNPFTPDSGNNGGMLHNSPRLANYLSLILPMCDIPFAIICIIVSVLIKQKVLIFISSLFLLLKTKNKKLILGFLPVLPILLLFYPEGRSFFYKTGHISVRLETYKNVITGFLVHPLSGFGLGVFPWGQDKIPQGVDAVIYSSVLQFICGLGILSLFWLFFVIKKNFKFSYSVSAISITIFAILSAFEYTIEIPKLWLIIMTIISFYLIEKTKKEGVIC